MRKGLHLLYILLAGMFALSLYSCSEDETYAEQKEKERDAINRFIGRDIKILDRDGNLLVDVGRINPISESTFHSQGNKTYVESNQYVVFDNSGVYMQIRREGAGERLASGQSKRVMARYYEFNIMSDTLQSTNTVSSTDSPWPDVIEISNSYGVFTASFSTEHCTMYNTYRSPSVPAGWLVPFTYIRLGRQSKSDEQIAHVRLIVPHSQGHIDASNNVYPCFYDITFQEER